MNTHITDDQVDAACKKLQRIIHAAENSNQAGEDAAVSAAAAPEMLAALQRASSFILCNGYDAKDQALLNEISAAIAKAEGRS